MGVETAEVCLSPSQYGGSEGFATKNSGNATFKTVDFGTL